MEKDLFKKYKEAIKEKSIDSLEKLYEENSDNVIIKFGYAKRLKHINIDLSIRLLSELIGTYNENYALIELGIIAREHGYYDLSRKYFNSIINNDKYSARDKEYAKLEMGRLEVKIRNNSEAYRLFNEIKDSSIGYFAYLELGKLYFKEYNNDEAIKCFQKSLDSEAWQNATLWLGRVEASNGKYLQAMIYFNELLSTPLRKEAMWEINKTREMQSNIFKKVKK